MINDDSHLRRRGSERKNCVSKRRRFRIRLPLWLLPQDTYERHWVVARRLRAARVKSVLDVGGEDVLRRFLRGIECVSVNLNARADVTYDGVALPFGDSSFEAVVALDTLEHIPPSQRGHFAAELLRVARELVVVATPWGTPTHSELEQRCLQAYRQTHGRDHEYLREHVEYGLPTWEELTLLFAAYDVEMAFCGDSRERAQRFLANLRRGPKRRGVRRLLASLCGILINASWGRRPALDTTPHEWSNRAYVFVSKA